MRTSPLVFCQHEAVSLFSDLRGVFRASMAKLEEGSRGFLSRSVGFRLCQAAGNTLLEWNGKSYSPIISL